jgi:hypothetical protein
LITKLYAIVGEYGVDFEGNCFGQGLQEGRGGLHRSDVVQLCEGKLREPVHSHKEIQLPLFGADLRDVDMEVADRIGLELFLDGLSPRRRAAC